MRTLVVLAILGAATTARAQFHMEDSLRGSTRGTAIGGSFSAEGWTVTAKADRIWWEIPRLARGSVEFTITGASLASNLLVNDNEIFSMYEAGYDITEPIRYAPDFRTNHYKALVRVYGQAETGREGAMKLMWGMCPSGAPGYTDDAMPECGCGAFFEEPFASGPTWDGSPRRIRVAWGDGHTRLFVDGVETVHVDWSESGVAYGPSVVHMMLGSARNEAVDSSSMPIGAVFSDLVVDGEEGPLSTCPEADAGIVEMPDAAIAEDAGAIDAAPPIDAATAIDARAGGDGGRRTTVEPGCGCRVAPRAAPGAWLALAALAISAARAARRPRSPAASRR